MTKNLTNLTITATCSAYKKRLIFFENGEWYFELDNLVNLIKKQGNTSKKNFSAVLKLLQACLIDENEPIDEQILKGIWQFELVVAGVLIQSECGPMEDFSTSRFKSVDKFLFNVIQIPSVIFTDLPLIRDESVKLI